MSFTDWFLRSLISQWLVLLTSRKKGNIMLPGPCACYLLFDLKRRPRRLCFISDQIVEYDFWFEDFFLLVVDVINPPGTYFSINIIDCSLLVDFQSSGLLSLLPVFFCMVRRIQFSKVFSIFLRQTLHASCHDQHVSFSN